MIWVIGIVMHILNLMKNLLLKLPTFFSQKWLFLNRKFCQWLHTWETILCKWMLHNLSRQVVSFRKLNIFVGILCPCNSKMFSFNSKGGENEKHLHLQSYMYSQNLKFVNSCYQNLSLMFAVAENLWLNIIFIFAFRKYPC